MRNVNANRLAAAGLLSLALGSPTAARAAERSFDEALVEMVHRSPVLAAKEAETAAVHQRNQSADYTYLPTVNGSVSRDRKSFLESQTGPFWSTSVGAAVDMNVYRFGADAARVTAARAEGERAAEDLKTLRLKVEGELAGDLLQVIAARQKRDILARVARMREELLTVAGARFQRGLLPREEVQKLEIDLASARISLQEQEREVKKAEQGLAPLLRDDTVRPDWPWLDRLTRAGESFLAAGAFQGLEDHPQWRAAEAAVRRADEDIVVARSRWLPSLDWKVSYSRLVGPEELLPDSQLETALTLTVPLFDRLEGLSQYRAAVSMRSAAAADFEDARLGLKKREAVARTEFEQTLLTTREHAKLRAASARLYQVSRTGFEKGAITVNDLTLDEARLHEIELAALGSTLALHRAVLELCHAHGLEMKDCAKRLPGGA